MRTPATFGRRFAGLGVVAAAGLAAAAVAAAAGPSRPSPTPAGGFDGPVAAPARAIDRDLERTGSAGLRRVPCDGGAPGAACWIAARP